MGRFPIARLKSAEVLTQASAALGRRVKVYENGVIYWVVKLGYHTPSALPPPEPLSLDGAPTELGWPIPIGLTSKGELWRDLPAMGHALIVGATGAGKSNWLHCALASLFTLVSPDNLQAAIIDPKRCEMTPWANAPHLIAPIAYTGEQAEAVLADLASECDRRGDLLASVGARDLAGYNRRGSEVLPLVLCVIDEMIDFSDNRTVCEHLKTIARRGRSAGVILWVSTQHAAAVAGLPRVVNVNLVTRLVFRVADGSAALCAGAPGAERIPQSQPGRFVAVLGGGTIHCQAWHMDDDQLESIAGRWGRGMTKPVPKLTPEQMRFLRAAIANDGRATGALAAEVFGGGENGRLWRRALQELDKLGIFCERRGASNTRLVSMAALADMGVALGEGD